MFQPIQNIKWDPQEPVDMINPYTGFYSFVSLCKSINIAKILQFVMDFHGKIESLAGGDLPKRVQKDLKKDVVNFTFRKLIDNYSRVKKVNIRDEFFFIS